MKMKWEDIPVERFDLAATLDSGQVFHWHRDGDLFSGVIGDEAVQIRQPQPDLLQVGRGQGELVRHYLALDHNLARMNKTMPKGDAHLRRAFKYAPGLRIMRQPKWECLATFITSSLKQVAHIRQISLLLRERFGQRVANTDLMAYPTPQALAKAGEAKLRACGLGYRAKHLHQTAALIASGGFDLEAVALLDDDAACAKLCELPGVGPKIAQCALLFSYERLGVFPIDVWIERVLTELYYAEEKDTVTSKQLKQFALEHFGPFRGYAQQWLFHHARTSGHFSKRKGD